MREGPADRREVTARARMAILLAILAAVACVRAAQPGPMFALDAAPEEFPAEVVVTTLPAVNIYGDRSDLRVLQLVDGAERDVGEGVRRRGRRVRAADRRRVRRAAHQGCGSRDTGWAGGSTAATARGSSSTRPASRSLG
jgi:hypothetical protein